MSIPEGAFRFVRAPRLRRKLLSRIGLIALIGGTSAAMGWSIGWWLVPFYWLAMYGLIIGAVGGAAGPREAPPPVLPVQDPESPPAPAGASVEAAPALFTTESAAPKRKRTRKPKARAPEVVLEAEPTWIQVAPGKFVRVENAPAAPTGGDDATTGGPSQALDPPETARHGEPPPEPESGGSPAADDQEVIPIEPFEKPAMGEAPVFQTDPRTEHGPPPDVTESACGTLGTACALADPNGYPAPPATVVPDAIRRRTRTIRRDDPARGSRTLIRTRRDARASVRLARPAIARARKGNRSLWPGRSRSARIR